MEYASFSISRPASSRYRIGSPPSQSIKNASAVCRRVDGAIDSEHACMNKRIKEEPISILSGRHEKTAPEPEDVSSAAQVRSIDIQLDFHRKHFGSPVLICLYYSFFYIETSIKKQKLLRTPAHSSSFLLLTFLSRRAITLCLKSSQTPVRDPHG